MYGKQIFKVYANCVRRPYHTIKIKESMEMESVIAVIDDLENHFWDCTELDCSILKDSEKFYEKAREIIYDKVMEYLDKWEEIEAGDYALVLIDPEVDSVSIPNKCGYDTMIFEEEINKLYEGWEIEYEE